MYGPNVPIMLGLNTQLETDGQKIVPAERYGLQVVSLGFLTQDDAPVIWRGPMLHGAIQQFFRDVRWRDIDYLLVDMPPGTGDIALSLSQSVPVAGAVVVTTPQAVSLADTRRAVAMYRKLNIPPLGLVENMSHFVCPGCGRESDIFGKGGGEQLATDMNIPFLGRIPLHEPVRTGGDQGVPVVIGDPQSAPARALSEIAERIAQRVSIASFARKEIPLRDIS
jgi:ATP-binding protein involved in chromosome partitioning